MRMDHSIGLGEEEVRGCCKRARRPVLDKRTGNSGGPARDTSDAPQRTDHK